MTWLLCCSGLLHRNIIYSVLITGKSSQLGVVLLLITQAVAYSQDDANHVNISGKVFHLWVTCVMVYLFSFSERKDDVSMLPVTPKKKEKERHDRCKMKGQEVEKENCAP